jgi:hypothetical protein
MTKIRIGAIGAGGFCLFDIQQFIQFEGAELVAIAGTHREAALAMARRFGVAETLEVESLLQLDQVDLVYIATPPFLHYAQVRAALEAQVAQRADHRVGAPARLVALRQCELHVELRRKRPRGHVAAVEGALRAREVHAGRERTRGSVVDRALQRA